MKISSAAVLTRATCGMALRSLWRRESKAPTPSARVTGLSSPSTIPTAMRGSSKRSRRGVLAEPDQTLAARDRRHERQLRHNDHRMTAIYRYRQERRFDKPPASIWPFISDTARL